MPQRALQHRLVDAVREQAEAVVPVLARPVVVGRQERGGLDVRVAGGALDDPDFIAGGDLVTYRFAAGSGPVTLSVALRYQPIAHGFAQDLFTDEADPSVKSFKRLYGAATLKAETIVSISAKVP